MLRQKQPCTRAVVLGVEAGRGMWTFCRPREYVDGPDSFLDLNPRDSTWPEKQGALGRERKDSRFDSDSTRTTVEDEVNAITQAAADVLGRGRRELGETVGAGGGEGKIAFPD